MEPANEDELEALRARLIQLTKENQELRFKNERLERLNKSLLESASWKVTAPLRTVGALVGRATEKWKALPRPAEEERQRGDPELLEPPQELASWPALSVVAAVYNKERELPFFLEGFARQAYPGELEVIVVDDCSKDATWETLEASKKKWPWLKTQRTEKNSGQCRARNMGIQAARGAIVFVMDGDCVVNAGYLRAHAIKHVLQDELDIVLGPYNIETLDRDPLEVLALYEKDPGRAVSDMKLQEPSWPESFLNCVTRNLSIKRRFLEANLLPEGVYDERFSYTANPDTGYGWEDVASGFRFYELGARIGFEPKAIALHVTHPPAVPADRQRLGLVKNFAKLLEKHPDLPLVARGWVNKTYSDMVTWLEKAGIEAGPELEKCVPLLSVATDVKAPLVRPATRRLRILTYRWHCGHQYDLWKLPHDFTLARGLTSMCNLWDYRQRPLPSNARFQDLERIDFSQFDAQILHCDENSLSPENSQGALTPDWGALFQHLKKNAKLPTVVVCHGTTQFHGQYDTKLERPDMEIRVNEAERTKLVDFLEDVLVVCNSYDAEKEWGWKRSQVIWHGFDPAEYPPARPRKQILTVAGDLKSRPHTRGYYLYEKVTRDLLCDVVSANMPNAVKAKEPSRYARSLSEYGGQWFRSYVDLVRDYSIFFNPTLRSCMPRARGEAMLLGLATVNAKNYDVERFIENGKNGFYATDPGELNEQLKFLSKNEAKARAIGLAGRQTALRLFHLDRYLAEWQALLEELTR